MSSSDDDVPKKKARPRLTAKFAAEQLGAKPGVMRRAILAQKYPKEGAGAFMTPYYQRAFTTFRHYYSDGPSALAVGLAKALSITQATRRENNSRAIRTFAESQLVKRKFKLLPKSTFSARVGGVELKLSPDLLVDENGKLRFLYVNCKQAQYPPETAKRLLEIACYIMWQNGQDVSPEQFEFVDLFTKASYTIHEVRQSTIDQLLDETKQVLEIWDEV
ncbi:MAG: hypothetical protein U1A73_24900 [Pseudomonas sp.]|nr:hypothetical protein [Pseudomonas sp.]